jgi:hypothetical protein
VSQAAPITAQLLAAGYAPPSWAAVTSVSGIDASTNAPSTGIPVYDTHGERINAPSTSIYSGSILTNIPYDQTNTLTAPHFDWTGSTLLGNGVTGHTLGLPSTTVETGFTGSLLVGWLDAGQANAQDPHQALPIYVLSGVLTVVPEPASLTTGMMILALVTGVRMLRRRLLA